jgi:hypothetical protein
MKSFRIGEWVPKEGELIRPAVNQLREGTMKLEEDTPNTPE